MAADEYVDLPTLKLAVGLAPDDTTADDLLSRALSAAARGIDRMAGRRFYLDAAVSARTYTPGGRLVCDEGGERLLVDDIGDAAGLVVESSTGGSWAPVTGYETAPDNALAVGRPITALRLSTSWWAASGASRVRVTARWGWPEVPPEVEQAVLIQASRLYKRKDSPSGVIGSAEWGAIRLGRVDPDVQALMQHLVLPGF